MNYQINEVFASLQGEGIRAGTANVFVRFSGCNMACDMMPGPKSPGGWICDTEFVSGHSLSTGELLDEMDLAMGGRTPGRSDWCVLTGGEPGLQLDSGLLMCLHARDWKVAVETNGTIQLPLGIDWITVSPKVPEHDIQQLYADEVKYVLRGDGQELPKPRCRALHKLLSPAFVGSEVDPHALARCIQLVKENPEWRLSVQQHKAWGIR